MQIQTSALSAFHVNSSSNYMKDCHHLAQAVCSKVEPPTRPSNKLLVYLGSSAHSVSFNGSLCSFWSLPLSVPLHFFFIPLPCSFHLLICPVTCSLAFLSMHMCQAHTNKPVHFQPCIYLPYTSSHNICRLPRSDGPGEHVDKSEQAN